MPLKTPSSSGTEWSFLAAAADTRRSMMGGKMLNYNKESQASDNGTPLKRKLYDRLWTWEATIQVGIQRIYANIDPYKS